MSPQCVSNDVDTWAHVYLYSEAMEGPTIKAIQLPRLPMHAFVKFHHFPGISRY